MPEPSETVARNLLLVMTNFAGRTRWRQWDRKTVILVIANGIVSQSPDSLSIKD